ncbi:neogenin-like [Patiria miniata]|uniref:Fibronectin type-III domain-containing protein n=1 Tax=Patiria miniata TaxID=46514 RepID=A0A914AXD3_PATMI|nr:neogenin-like [Patiria miniata]
MFEGKLDNMAGIMDVRLQIAWQLLLFLGQCKEKCLAFEGGRSTFAGDGTTVSSILATHETVPSVALEFNSSEPAPDSIKFTWNTIPYDSTDGNIWYQAQLTHSGREIGWKTVITESVTFDGLLPCSLYTLQVWPHIRVERGPPMLVQQRTNTIVPDAVKGLSFTVFRYGQLNVKWKASTNPDNSCRATDFLVTYELTNLEQCQEMQGNIKTRSTSRTAISIQGLKAYSTYNVTVTPRNEAGLGQSRSKQTQTGRTVPVATPVNITSVATANSLSFGWDPVPCGRRGGPLTGYSYRFGKSGSGRPMTSRDAGSDSATFLSLPACTSYWFKVRAYSSAIWNFGPWTDETQADTQMIVPDPVEGLTLTPLGHDRLVVRWSASSNTNNNCHATDYHVTYELINLEQCHETLDHNVSTINVSVTTMTINGLHAYSSYNVTVTPRNEAGYGPVLYQTVQTGERKPTGTPILGESTASSDNITFTWSQVPCGGRGSATTMYRYKFMKRGNTIAIEKDDTTAMSVTFRGLSPCTSYAFVVRAFNSKGHGPWTDESYQDTAEIHSLNLEPSTDEIKVSWTTAGNEDNPCPPVTSYRVSYQLLNLEQCQQMTDPALIHAAVVDGSDIDLTSMHTYSTYIVQVAPANNAGAKYMKSKTVTTEEGVPLAAPKLDNVFWSNRSVRMFWHPIPCGKRGGDITGYAYELRDASGSIIQTADTTAESVEVDGLSQGGSYSFRMRAFTRVGPGPWKEVDFDIPTVDTGARETSGSGVAGPAFIGVGLALGIIFSAAVAVLVAFARHFRIRCLQTMRPDGTTSPNTGGPDNADAIYFDINDDVELKKMSATPSRESATGASTVPSGKSTTRVSAPRASTKRSTTKATKKTKMADGQSGARHYENTVIP